jgi:hypothetical protein
MSAQSFSWLSSIHATWVIPMMGLAVAGLAFVFGRRLLAPRAPAGPAEQAPSVESFLKGINNNNRRAAPRRKGNSVQAELSDGVNPPQLCWVIDRSVGGLALLTEREVTPGSTLKVRPSKTAESTPWTPVIIRSCRPEGAQWEVGCQFAQTPSWNVLLLFG